MLKPLWFCFVFLIYEAKLALIWYDGLRDFTAPLEKYSPNAVGMSLASDRGSRQPGADVEEALG